MFQISEDNSIGVTRGDVCFFDVEASDDGKPYLFQPGDVLRIKVYERKNAAAVVLQKDFLVDREQGAVSVFLTGEDTKFGAVISKAVPFWYEVELNPDTAPQTIVGFDEDGAKIFMLYPEGADIPERIPGEEEVGFVDDELDISSVRPVQNRVLAAAFARLEGLIRDLEGRVQELEGRENG